MWWRNIKKQETECQHITGCYTECMTLTKIASYEAAIAHACQLIENGSNEPNLETLAKAAHMSPSHFHRVFTSITGITPKAYAMAHRSKKFQAELTKNTTVTEAMYRAGFNSSGRLYETSAHALGMTPTMFKSGGKGAVMRFAIGECSLGSILVAATDIGISAITMADNPEVLLRDIQDRFPKAELIGGDKNFEQLIAMVVGFIEHPENGLNLPLDVRGTAFQQRVWQALRRIPLGKTATYAYIAKSIGRPKAVRAVAQACGANNIAVAIPCHRVVRTDGALSGYRWGVERKAELLKRERTE